MYSKKSILIFLLPILVLILACKSSDGSVNTPDTDEDPNSGTGIVYFNQTSPTAIPSPFAPPELSSGYEFGGIYYPDQSEFYFSRYNTSQGRWSILFMKLNDGEWSTPRPPTFAGPYNEANPQFTPSGDRVYWCTNRPRSGNGTGTNNWDLWYADREGDGWGDPQNLGEPVNSFAYEDYPSIAPDGTLYFISSREGGFGGQDIYRAVPENGVFTSVENLGSAINTENNDFDPMATNENYLVFVSGEENDDLYISFKNADNEWESAIRFNGVFNTEGSEYGPKLSPDKAYFFFTRSAGSRVTYWVNAVVLENM